VDDFVLTRLRPLAPGLIPALVSILFGFGLGGLFGGAEDPIREHLNNSAEKVLSSAYDGSVGKKDAVVRKSWAYLKRAHLHAGGIGAAALGSIILLSLLGVPGLLEKLSALAFGAGSLIYSIFWMLAGFQAPALGGTEAAKEALKYVAIPGAGLCILGLVGTLCALVVRLRRTTAVPETAEESVN
jgi:hypothetical protein